MSGMTSAARALVCASLLVGCSETAGPGPVEVRYDVGALPDASRDTAPGDSSSIGDTSGDGPIADSSASDGTTTIDAAPTDGTGIDAGPPPTCPTTFPGTTSSFTYPRAARGELLAAITWDELTMVWTTGDDPSAQIHYSDRTAVDGAFTADHVLAPSLGPFPADKVALSADGLTMSFVSADHRTLRQVKRAARGAEFDAASATAVPFARLTGKDGEGGAVREVADLVLSRDGKWLFFTSLNATRYSVMLSVLLSDGTWDAPTPITSARFEMSGGKRRRPTGLSGDARTLFYFDETSQTLEVAFRPADSVTFTSFAPFSPNGRRAMPVGACNRVYLDIEDVEADDAGAPDGGPPSSFSIVHAP
jgi:hypothetical protein